MVTALLLLVCGMGWAQTKAEEVYSTCLFGSSYNQTSVGSYTATWTTTNGDFSWTIVNGNNNNNNWNFIKFGRKNNASVGQIVTASDYAQAITRVDLTIDAITANNVNSITLYTGSDGATWTSAGSFAKASGLQTVTLASPAVNQYYKIEFDCASGTANGLVTVSKVEYYYNTGGAASPSISADNVDLAYDATSGVIEYTINNPANDGVLSANTDAEWITIGTVGTTVPFTCEANDGTERTAVVTLTYTYGNDNISKNVTITQAANPNGPGSEANPYTVAQARAAIDAGTGTQGVYATGIVTAIPTAYNSQYGNITFNFVDNEEDTDFLQAYRCGGDEAADVTIGDIVVVYGNLTKYGSTYEFGQGCTLVSLTHPAVDVEAPTFDPAAGTYAEAQNVTITCATPNATIYYTTDGTEPTTNSTVYSSSLNIATTTTIKAVAYVNDRSHSTIATATYHINSQENPYTVAQSLAFNEYPANGIYVHGIVSTAPTQSPTNNGELTYYISVDGEATDQLEVYKGKGLDEAAFTAQDDIQVGDIVTIYGNVVIYGTSNPIKEFAQGNYLVEFERPVSTEPSITVADATLSVPAEMSEGILTVTYENITEIAAEVYFCDANGGQASYDWITAEINNDNNIEYLVDANEGEARTAYLKVYALDDNAEDVYSNLVTINQAAYVAPVEDYATLPFEFDGGRADIANTSGLTHEGLDSDYSSSPKLKFKTTGTWVLLQFNERPGTLTFDIKGNGFSGGTFTVQTSEDGVTYTDLENYTDANFGNTIYSEEFTNLGENVRYIKWIYTEKSSGNVALGNINLAEYTEPVLVPSITVDPATVDADAEEHDGTLNLTYQDLTISNMGDFDIQYYDAEGEETTEPDWIEVVVAEQDPQIGEGYVVSYFMLENEGEARTAYFKVFAMGIDDFVYSNLVTVTQAAPVVPAEPGNWVLTNLADLTENDIFVIVGTDADTDGTYALPNDGGNSAPAATPVTIVEGTVSGEPAANLQWNLSGNTTDGFTFYPNGDAESWLYCSTTNASGSNNNIKVGTGERNLFVLDDDGYLVTNDEYATRYLSIYFNAGVAQDWRGYVNTNSAVAISFYKKVVEPETYTLEINGYTEGDNGGYFLIASPVTVDPAQVGMTERNYDLYYFDQAQEDEWQNYKQDPFDLVPGKGYLYAKQADTDDEVFHFTLTGMPYTGNGQIELRYNEGGDYPGWNLIGNPYGETATIDHDFYIMNAAGTEIITGSGNEVEAMQGIFVIASEDGEKVTFRSHATNNKGGKIVVHVRQNRDNNVIDRAIVRVNNGGRLPKIMLNPDNTKVYIPQDGDEFAVVRSEKSGRIPVVFKPSKSGDYIFSVNTENLNLLYLRLIDHETGEVTNLLRRPDYMFHAETYNKPDRFELEFREGFSAFKEVFPAVNRSEDDFGYFSNGDIIINGTGVLQVIDANGRIIKSENVNGNSTLQLNDATGIYMLRLINGENTKTQKIVVK